MADGEYPTDNWPCFSKTVFVNQLSDWGYVLKVQH